MKLRYLLTALLIGALPLTSHADVDFSIGIAPPPLPVVVQPPCPVDGYLWTPGYYAYGDVGYSWVPGVWVAPPQVGVLWTPGYWGFSNGFYGFNEGYWGPTVGFYGGVNYGYGYGGVGYYGGRWDGGSFRYNTAVTRVNTSVIHNTYVDRSAVNRVSTRSRASFNGPGGVTARPTAAQRAAARESHIPPTAAQVKNRPPAVSPHARAAGNAGRPAAERATAGRTNREESRASTRSERPAAATRTRSAERAARPESTRSARSTTERSARPTEHAASTRSHATAATQRRAAAPRAARRAAPQARRAPSGGGDKRKKE
jgi:hypothetical protein